MKPFHILLILFTALTFGAITTGCWTDLEQYDEFVCERFGGDFDGDGVCSSLDCDDGNPQKYEGAPCDDGDEETINDTYNVDCICEGV